jgi:hypothetical protein
MVTKTRQTVEPSTPYLVDAVHNGSHFGSYPVWAFTPEYLSWYEWIETEEHGFGRDNFCSHYKRSVNMNKGADSFNWDTWYSGDHSEGVWHWIIGSQAAGWYALDRSGTFMQYLPDMGNTLAPLSSGIGSAPVPDGWWSMVDSAMEHMLPGIKPELSLINSLIELKDFKTLPRTLSSIATMSKHLIKAPGRYPLKKVMKVCADAYLQDKFNIAPLISDIMGVYDTFKSIPAKANRLRKDAGTVKHLHYRKDLSAEYPPIIISGSGNPLPTYYVLAGHQANWNIQGLYTLNQFTVSMSYKFFLPDMSEKELLARAYLDSLGVNLNPQIIWNAIPWSFVVDWLVGIGPWLSKLQMRNIEPEVHMMGCSASWHQKRTSSFSGGQSGSTIATWNEDLYIRVPTSPSLSLFQTSGLSLTESSLALALALTRK